MKYHKSNFKSIGNLIVPLVKRHGKVNIINCSKLLNIWETLVGKDISKKARPIRIKTIKGGEKNILHLGMTGPYLAELSLQTQEIIEKINSYYSNEVIVQIKLQTLQDINDKNVVKLDHSDEFGAAVENAVPTDPKLAVVQLENALTRMKNNLSNSRKKNDIMED